MTEELWSLACAVAEIAEPFVEIFGDPVYKSIMGDGTPPAVESDCYELSNPRTVYLHDVPLSEMRHIVNNHLPTNIVLFLF
jgi:hypothetical protein